MQTSFINNIASFHISRALMSVESRVAADKSPSRVTATGTVSTLCVSHIYMPIYTSADTQPLTAATVICFEPALLLMSAVLPQRHLQFVLKLSFREHISPVLMTAVQSALAA